MKYYLNPGLQCGSKKKQDFQPSSLGAHLGAEEMWVPVQAPVNAYINYAMETSLLTPFSLSLQPNEYLLISCMVEEIEIHNMSILD